MGKFWGTDMPVVEFPVICYVMGTIVIIKWMMY